MSSKRTEAAILSFIAGAAVAAGVALLFAPKTGAEVRERLGEAKDDALDKLKQRVKGMKRAGKEGDTMGYDGGDCWI